jgi:predicted phage terminase large subunit-like protein
MPTFRITNLHPGQHEIISDRSWRFGCLTAGRRWGKTRVGVGKCVSSGLENRGGYFWITPTYPLAEEGWWTLKEIAAIFPRGKVRIEEVHMRLWLPNGAWVQIKSGDRPMSLRARGLRGVVFDEAAYLKEDVWPTVRPSLIDWKGWALFITTPNSFNWYYQLIQKHQGDSDWKFWQKPSAENPIVTADELESSKRALGSLMYAQEHDAQFVSTFGRLFSREHFRYWWRDPDKGVWVLNVSTPEDPEKFKIVEPEKCWVFQTCDVAGTDKDANSYFVLSTWAVTEDRDLILVGRYREHIETVRHLAVLREENLRWRPSSIEVEKANVGLALVQAARRAGLPVRGLDARGDKVSRARVAQARLEAHTVFFPIKATWLPEWEEEVLGFPDGEFDDQVDTFSYAAIKIALGGWGKIRRGRSIWSGRQPRQPTRR